MWFESLAVWLFALLLLATGLSLLVLMLGVLRRRSLLLAMETSRLGTRPRGFVELKGKVKPIETVVSPYTRRPCVCFRVHLEEWHEGSGRSGGAWRTVRTWQESRTFLLDDGSGLAWIDPTCAELDLRQDAAARSGLLGTSEEFEEFLGRVGVGDRGALGFRRKLRVTERNLSPGDEVYVLGKAEEPDATCGDRSVEAALRGRVSDFSLVTAPWYRPISLFESSWRRAASHLFLSDSGEARLTERLFSQALAMVAVALVVLAAGAWLAYWRATA